MKTINKQTNNLFKVVMFFIAFLTAQTTIVFSQEICQTVSGEDNLREYSENNLLPPDALNNKFCIKIYVHVIRNSNGTGGQSVAHVNTALGFLAMDFNPHGIYFKWDGVIDYIDNGTYYSNPGNYIFSVNNHMDGIDIYLYGDDSGGGIGGGIGAGSSSTDGPYGPNLWVSGYFLDNVALIYPLVRSHIISHEMGHVLNLYHTHHGTVTENLPQDPLQCKEFVNGSNGHICGDYILDTPADPKMNYLVDLVTCDWLGSGMDANGDPYNPDELNIMSYTQPKCMDHFSILQVKRMKSSLLLLPYLQNVVINYTTNNTNPCNDRQLTLNYYPNPANQNLTLDLRENDSKEYIYQIYNELGELVLSGVSLNELKTINTITLREGHYYLHVYDEAIPVIKHLYIQH